MKIDLSNMGSFSKKESEDFFKKVAKELKIDYKMEWGSVGDGICLKEKKTIYLGSRIIGEYPWRAKEHILHEITHAACDDDYHAKAFYKRYSELLQRFMVGV